MDDRTLNKVALLYKDLLSKDIHSILSPDKELLLSLKPTNKIIAVGGVDQSNWTAYPLTYLLTNKLVAPTVLDESKIYQSMHAMRVHDDKIIHPQNLISQSVVIRIVGYDNSSNINDYINSFINMCIASDECKIIFVVVDCDKKFYRDRVYIRKSNSTFIETSSGKPYQVESTPLCISPDQITFFNNIQNNKKTKQVQLQSVNVTSTVSSRKSACSTMIKDPDLF